MTVVNHSEFKDHALVCPVKPDELNRWAEFKVVLPADTKVEIFLQPFLKPSGSIGDREAFRIVSLRINDTKASGYGGDEWGSNYAPMNDAVRKVRAERTQKRAEVEKRVNDLRFELSAAEKELRQYDHA
jgi:hypothetical protein